jgi:hypothetical protein
MNHFYILKSTLEASEIVSVPLDFSDSLFLNKEFMKYKEGTRKAELELRNLIINFEQMNLKYTNGTIFYPLCFSSSSEMTQNKEILLEDRFYTKRLDKAFLPINFDGISDFLSISDLIYSSVSWKPFHNSRYFTLEFLKECSSYKSIRRTYFYDFISKLEKEIKIVSKTNLFLFENNIYLVKLNEKGVSTQNIFSTVLQLFCIESFLFKEMNNILKFGVEKLSSDIFYLFLCLLKSFVIHFPRTNYLLRPYVKDETFTVYRSGFLSLFELDTYKNNSFICTKEFFITTLNKDKALKYLNLTKHDIYQKCLLKMSLNIERENKNFNYMYLSEENCFYYQEEMVLIKHGTLFMIQKLEKINDLLIIDLLELPISEKGYITYIQHSKHISEIALFQRNFLSPVIYKSILLNDINILKISHLKNRIKKPSFDKLACLLTDISEKSSRKISLCLEKCDLEKYHELLNLLPDIFNNKCINKFSLTSNKIPNNDRNFLIKYIKIKNSFVLVLDLSNQDFSERTLSSFLKHNYENDKLEKLIIRNNCLESKSFKSFNLNPSLRSLDLSQNNLGGNPNLFRLIMKEIRLLNNLTCLKLNAVGLDNKMEENNALMILKENLNSIKIKKLGLGQNGLLKNGLFSLFKEFSEQLSKNKSITYIDFSFNCTEKGADRSFAVFANVLDKNRNLRKLNFSFNKLEQNLKGTRKILSCLTNNIEVLDIRNKYVRHDVNFLSLISNFIMNRSRNLEKIFLSFDLNDENLFLLKKIYKKYKYSNLKIIFENFNGTLSNFLDSDSFNSGTNI